MRDRTTRVRERCVRSCVEFLFVCERARVLSQRACDCHHPRIPATDDPPLPREAHTLRDGCVARGAAMASAPKPRRTLEATELKQVVAELRQFASCFHGACVSASRCRSA